MAASVTTGVMNPLLSKLTKLVDDEYKKLTRVRKQALFLRNELSAMKALLDKMELMDKLDPLAKNWRDHVREMSYDMENCIEDFMHDIGGADAKAGVVKKMAKRLRRLGRRHQIANRIEELKVLAVEANARREMYKIDACVDPSPGVVAIDPRISSIYKEAEGLVGIDGPREELVSWFIDSQKKLKVVSIVGFGGLGKTTLAKQVYDEIGGQFDCKAFVSVSQRPDLKSLLIGLQRKLGMADSSHSHELQEIIDRVREYLKHKRYIIVVDDLWDESSWNTISCAFPENSIGSRVMVTTRVDDVALLACHHVRASVYRLKPLEEQESRRLFFNRVFGSENVCPPQFEDISDQILKKCGGLPLAIITIASLLASQKERSLNEWKSIKKSIGANFATKPTLEEMRGILNLSYTHLNVHLRPCFLYLGMYPEDREIMRNGLVRQWISEGLVCRSHGVDLEDVAKSYFNELINKSLIQPERTEYGEVLSCRVHDMLLDLILSKSTEDNFINVAYNYEDMERLQSCEYKARRLSLKPSDGGSTSGTLATSLSEVRSYAQFGESKYIPPLSLFKYLRVLFFEFPSLWDMTIDLTAIGHLFLLRYLKVLAESAGVALPTEIQGLEHLETLELHCHPPRSFPSDITHLVNLLHLILPHGSGLPKGIKNMKSLLTLHGMDVSGSSLEDIKGLSELTNLNELELSTRFELPLTVECVDALVSSIRMLRELKDLTLQCQHESDGYDMQLGTLPDPPPSLEVLTVVSWKFSRVPKWIGELHCLRILCLEVLQLSSDNVCVLGELPCLVSVSFHGLDVSQHKVVVGTGLFPILEDISFASADAVSVYVNEYVTSYLTFQAGGMPKLQRLTLTRGWNDWTAAAPVGMEFLPCLQEIQVWLKRCRSYGLRHDVESAFKSAVRVHPRHISVTVN